MRSRALLEFDGLADPGTGHTVHDGWLGLMGEFDELAVQAGDELGRFGSRGIAAGKYKNGGLVGAERGWFKEPRD